MSLKKGKSDMLLRKEAVRLTKNGLWVLVKKGIKNIGLNKKGTVASWLEIEISLVFKKRDNGILVGKERVESLKERSEVFVRKGENSVGIRWTVGLD